MLWNAWPVRIVLPMMAASCGRSGLQALEADAADRVFDASGSADARVDRPPDILPAPGPLRPWNGEATGSVWFADNLRPTFRWTAVAGAARYEIVIDDSCPPVSFSACAFPSPEVAEETAGTTFRPASALPVARVAPVGRRYTWRVRACGPTECSPWAPPRIVNVGRLVDDLDGDGYSEIVVASAEARELGEPGRLFVFRGGSAPDDRADAIIPAEVIYANQRLLARVGDLNADGFADLATGPGLRLLPGGPSLHPESVLTIVPLSVRHDFPSPAGDVNGDGYDDVVMSGGARGSTVAIHLGGEAPSSVPWVAIPVGHYDAVGSGAGAVRGGGYSGIVTAAWGEAALFAGALARTWPPLFH